MCFSVECAFPHLGKRGGTSRKGALWSWHLTKKRILNPLPDGKAQSACAFHCVFHQKAQFGPSGTGM